MTGPSVARSPPAHDARRAHRLWKACSKCCPDWRGMPPSEWSCRLGWGASSSRTLRRRTMLSTIWPVSPCSTTSSTEPRRIASTGVPQAIASIMEKRFLRCSLITNHPNGRRVSVHWFAGVLCVLAQLSGAHDARRAHRLWKACSKRCPDWRGMPPSEWSCRLGGGASSSRAHRASRRGLNCRTDNDDRGDGRRKAQKGDTADVRHAAGRGHGLLSRFD